MKMIIAKLIVPLGITMSQLESKSLTFLYFGSLAALFKIETITVAQIITLTLLIFIDTLLGGWAAYKDGTFKISKAMIFAPRVAFFSSILFLIDLVERHFSMLGWLSEAVTVPIVLLYILSLITNAGKAGLISGKLVESIRSKIDAHK